MQTCSLLLLHNVFKCDKPRTKCNIRFLGPFFFDFTWFSHSFFKKCARSHLDSLLFYWNYAKCISLSYRYTNQNVISYGYVFWVMKMHNKMLLHYTFSGSSMSVVYVKVKIEITVYFISNISILYRLNVMTLIQKKTLNGNMFPAVEWFMYRIIHIPWRMSVYIINE